ncbi:MAG: D-alanyl-D-alanine carboxypeptidase family protein [Opitutaceae bacterium]|nr:D-alanyl-D-alanine carboxypeptidase family protein [Opitutaceae bacterium]
MLLSRRLLLAATFALAPALFAAAARKSPARPASPDDATAFRGAIVVDAATGKVLHEDRADYSGPPASMVKLMTFAVLHDRIASGALTLATPVKISVEDSKIGGTQVYLDPRETFPVEDLIHAMMIQSANDAAYALARTAAGSVPAFIEQMNAKARALGMTHTTFRTPHGLPPPGRRVADGDITTPRDYALLCRHLVQNTNIIAYTSVRDRAFGPNRTKGPIKMDNHNKLLGKVAGVDGLKTGYTTAAAYCTSVTAQRDGRRVVVVIMGSLGPGGEIDKGKTRDLKAAEWLERGFAALPAAPVASSAAPKAADSLVTPAPRAPAGGTASPAPTKEEPVIKLNLPKR